MASPSKFELLFEALPLLADFHAKGLPVFILLDRLAKEEAERQFGPTGPGAGEFGPIGLLKFPYFEMGAINSVHAFGLDELIIFSFYYVNRRRYRKVADLGANIGLHSVVLDRCGFDVQAFEPDPLHCARLKQNLELNDCAKVQVNQAAVSDKKGTAEFVRVLGNTTSSHLAGSKSPYGPLERFPVEVRAIAPVMEWSDLIKMDVEGHEKQILQSTTKQQWAKTDAILEVGSEENAAQIYSHFMALGVGMFSQKTGWKRISRLPEMPVSYKEGSLFISSKPRMPWTAD